MPGVVRAVAEVLDPRLWFHVAKLVRAASYSHVVPRRELTAGPELHMSPTASLRNGSRIRLGREVHVGERTCLWAGNGTGRITIGDNALIAPDVFVTASNYRTAPGVPIMYQDKLEADVVIGSDVWIGTHVVVLPGVTIGDGAVVAAGAVVTKSLPAGCIAGGIPARVLGWREGAGPADAPSREAADDGVAASAAE